MATVKVENYSAEQSAALVASYTAGETVEALAAKLGKSVQSVIAKLAKEQVYKAQTPPQPKRAMLKKDMVAQLAVLLAIPEEVIESLEKATGPALMLVLNALKREINTDAA